MGESRSARPPATSSTATSPATTRSSRTGSTSSSTGVPCRSRAGRTARQNLLFVGRLEDRKGFIHLLKAYRILRKTGCDCRLLVAGSGPQEREARRYVLTRRLPGVEFLGRVSDRREGAAVPDGRRLHLAGDGPRIVRDRAARGDGGRRADRLQRHPRLQGRGATRRAGPARPAAQSQGDCHRDRAAPGRPRPSRPDERQQPGSRAGFQLGACHGEGGRLLRLRHPQARRDGIAAARLPRRASRHPPGRPRSPSRAWACSAGTTGSRTPWPRWPGSSEAAGRLRGCRLDWFRPARSRRIRPRPPGARAAARSARPTRRSPPPAT